MASMADPELECPVCHELFNVPKVLPCYHLACRDCVISWLKKGGQRGCPLCRAPILPPTHQGQGLLDSLVDALPTDKITESHVKGQQIITGPDVCAVCPNNMAATSYCVECEDKLCATCSRHHKRLRATKDHSLQDINTITAQDLSDHFPLPCQNHMCRTSELYCSSHHELICWECATRHHHSCQEVKVLADVANEKRGQLGQLVQTWRTKEAAFVRQIQSRKDTYAQQRRKVTSVFDGLEQDLKTRRHELLDAIKKAEDSDEELENARAMLMSHIAAMERLLGSRSDGVVVQMSDQLEPRSRDVEKRCGHANNVKVEETVQLDQQRIVDIKSLLSALASTSTTTHTTPAVSTTPTTPDTNLAVSTTSTTPHNTPAVSTTHITSTTRTTPKPTGAALARVLKVGDRVRVSDIGRRRRWAPGPGTVSAIPSRKAAARGGDTQDVVDVRWDDGSEWCCCMGRDNVYDLELL